MKNSTGLHQAVLLAIAFFAVGTLQAVEPAIPPETQQRLKVLQSSYESYLLQSTTLPFETGLAALNQKVKPALMRISADAAQKKNLDLLVLIKEDIKKVDSGGILIEGKTPSPEPLRAIHTTYKLELLKLEAARKSHIADAQQRYDAGLAQVQDEMTAAQNVDIALHVKQLRAKLMANPDGRLPVESARTSQPVAGPVAVVHMKSVKATFENRTMPYTNRQQDVFVLSQIPASLKGLSFFQTTGGSKDPCRVEIKSPGILYVACAESEGGEETAADKDKLAKLNFKDTGLKFTIYNIALAIYAKEVSASLTLPSPGGFCGFIVISK